MPNLILMVGQNEYNQVLAQVKFYIDQHHAQRTFIPSKGWARVEVANAIPWNSDSSPHHLHPRVHTHRQPQDLEIPRYLPLFQSALATQRLLSSLALSLIPNSTFNRSNSSCSLAYQVAPILRINVENLLSNGRGLRQCMSTMSAGGVARWPVYLPRHA